MTRNDMMDPPTLAHWGVAWMTTLLIFALLTSAHAADLYTGAEAYKRGDFTTALREWRPLAKSGHIEAQFQLGVMYERGEGVLRNDAQAVKWYSRAAMRGDADAQNNLGAAYAKGRGVPQNDVQAVKLFRKAAVQGLATAQRNLGIMYSNGDGVRRNKTQALAWLIVAAGQGDIQAERGKNHIAKSMIRRKRARAQRLAREYWETYVLPFQN